jgi:Lrp/AsnC family transcriptional regulator, regulator for asnA, asnC and gidA
MRGSNPDDVGARRNRRADELSDLDKGIIEHLQQDGRRAFTQIAAALGVSEAAVRARTNRLVERGILQVVGVADPVKLGFQQALIGIRCEPGRLLEVADALAALPEVDYVVVTAGRFDILIEAVAEDNEGLLAFLNDTLQPIGGVRETETFTYLRLVKQTYQFGTR